MSELSKIEKLNKILHYVECNDITAYKIAIATKISEAGIGKILNKSSKNPQERTVDVIYDYLFSNKEESTQSNKSIVHNQPNNMNETNKDKSSKENQNELKAHFEKLLKKVNKKIDKYEKEAIEDVDALIELNQLIKVKKSIIEDLESF